MLIEMKLSLANLRGRCAAVPPTVSNRSDGWRDGALAKLYIAVAVTTAALHNVIGTFPNMGTQEWRLLQQPQSTETLQHAFICDIKYHDQNLFDSYAYMFCQVFKVGYKLSLQAITFSLK
jgi:hypothetical protein